MAQMEDKIIESQSETLGESFVRKFPSQVDDDPELKAKQERNVQWLIDTLVPQSGTDVALTAGSFFAGGPIGRALGKTAKPALSKYYASILGSGKVPIKDIEGYIHRILRNPDKLPANRKAMNEIVESSPSMKKLDIEWKSSNYSTPSEYINPEDVSFKGSAIKYGKDFEESSKAFSQAVRGLMIEARDAHAYYYGARKSNSFGFKGEPLK
jgi:hypothetical protein